jgi:C4-dicarboxylate transporter DctM subunit
VIEYLPIFFFVVFLSLGTPIAFSLAVGGIIGILFTENLMTALNLLIMLPHRVVSNYVLAAIPMFLLIGYLAEASGLTAGTFRAAKKWFGRSPGGLAIATSISSGIFAAASGSSVSACAVFGKVAIPEMEKAGYNRSFNMGTVAASACLASTIPPSLALILYGMLSDTSVIKLFTAGIIPGICQMLVIIVTILFIVWFKPELFPASEKFSWSEKIRSLSGIWPLLSIVVAILACIYLGIATVTESAAAGAFVTIVIVVVQGKIGWIEFWRAAVQTCRTTAMIMAILVGGTIFSTYVGMTDLAPKLVGLINSYSLSPKVIMLILIPIFLLLGILLDGSSIIILTVPLLNIIAEHFAIDKIWLGVFYTFVIDLGALTPPVGRSVQGCVPLLHTVAVPAASYRLHTRNRYLAAQSHRRLIPGIRYDILQPRGI